MNTRLSESDLCVEWLKQFDIRESIIAKSIVDSLYLISSKYVCSTLWNMVEQKFTSSEKIAIYPISNKTKGQFGSEHLIGYSFTQAKPHLSTKIEICPDINTVIENKITDIVLVDDIIASGGTVVDFLTKNEVPFLSSKLKSQISRKKIRIHIFSYCAYEEAIKKILKSTKSLSRNNIYNSLTLNKKTRYFSCKQIDFIKQVSGKLNSYGKKNPFGYNATSCPVVFEHSCPNNTPAFLHTRGKKYQPLFPNKSIHPIIQRYFNYRKSNYFDLIDTHDLKSLSLFLEKQEHKSFYDFAIYLRLINKGVTVSNIPKYTTWTPHKLKEIEEQLQEMGAFKDNKITNYGQDLLKKFILSGSDAPKKRTKTQKNIYLPTKINNLKR